MRNDVTDGGDVHEYVVVDLNCRMHDDPDVEAVTPVVELTVVAHEPEPIVAADA